MEEKINLLDLDINTDKVIEDIQALTFEIAILKKEQEEALKAGGDLSKEYIASTAALKNKQSELKQTETVYNKLTAAQSEQAGTLQKLEAENAKLLLEQKKLNLETAEGAKRNAEIVATINKNTDAIKANKDATSAGRLNVGQYSKDIKEATASMGAFGGPVGAATNAVTGFGAAAKAAMGPIGLLIAVFGVIVGAFKSFFESSEEGQNTLKRLQAVFNVVVGNIKDLFASFGKTLYEIVSSPKETLMGLVNFIKDQVMNRIKSVGLAFAAIKKMLSGDLKEGMKDLGNAYLQAVTGVENFAEKAVNAYNKIKGSIKGIIDETQKEIDIAKRLADQQALNEKRERDALVQNAQDRIKLNKLKNEIDDKEKNSAQERLNLIDQENALLDKMLDRNLLIAKTKYEIKKAQNELSNSTKEDLNEEAALLAAVYDLEAQTIAQRKEMVAKRVEAGNQIRAEEEKQAKERADKALRDLDNEIKLYKLNNQSKLENNKLLTEQSVNEEISRLEAIKAKELEYANKSIEDKLALKVRQTEIEQQYDAEQAALKGELRVQNLELEYERLEIDYANKMTILNDNIVAQLDLEKSSLEARKQQELKNAEITGASVELINQKYAKIEIDIERAKMAAKMAVLSDFAGNIAAAFGQSTTLGKAAASAQTAINTYQGAMAAFSAAQIIPYPFGQIVGAASAAAVAIAGAKAIRDIWAVKADMPGASASSGGGGGGTIPSISMPKVSAVSPETIKSMSEKTKAEAVKGSINAEIGQGIVSRSQSGVQGQIEAGVIQGMAKVNLQPVLLQSDVEAKAAQSEANLATQIL